MFEITAEFTNTVKFNIDFSQNPEFIIAVDTNANKPEQSKTVTPDSAGFTVTPDPTYALSSVVVNGDADLTAGNVRAGVDIFGTTGTFTIDANATAGDVLNGKTAYVNGNKITGTIFSKSATTITPGTTDQVINAGQYLSGNQTVSGDSDLAAGNIKKGVNIFGVVGTFTDDADAAAGDILSGKTAYVNGSKVTGNITSKSAATYTPGTTSQTISSGQYLSGAQTISGDADLIAGNIKKGIDIFGVTGTYDVGGSYQPKTVTPTAGGATITPDPGYDGLSSVTLNGDADLVAGNVKTGVNIFGVTGNYTSDATAAAGDMLSGKTAYANGSKVTGSIASKGAQTYTPGTANQTIGSGQYLSGIQTISGDADLVAGNIKTGVNIFGVNGNYTSDANAVSGNILSGKTAYVNGAKLTGTMDDKSGTTAHQAAIGINPNFNFRMHIPANGYYATNNYLYHALSNIVTTPPQGTVSTNINMRSGPGTGYSSQGQANGGSKVYLTGVTSGSWVQVYMLFWADTSTIT